MTTIHPTAIVDPSAELGDDVTIGAYAIIKGAVRIGAGTIVHEHTHVHGPTVIGAGGELGPAAYVGLKPQHLHADLKIGHLSIGDRVVIREMASVHRSTHAGKDHATRIGDDCFLMGGVHIGHDCVLANGVIAANAALLGGHCIIGEKAFLGGGSTMHQFVRIGRLAIIGGNEKPTQDVPPFGAMRNDFLRGYNAIGCKRAGMSREVLHAIRGVYRSIQHSHNRRELLDALDAEHGHVPEVLEIIEFIRTSKRGILPSLPARSDETAAMGSDSSIAN